MWSKLSSAFLVTNSHHWLTVNILVSYAEIFSHGLLPVRQSLLCTWQSSFSTLMHNLIFIPKFHLSHFCSSYPSNNHLNPDCLLNVSYFPSVLLLLGMIKLPATSLTLLRTVLNKVESQMDSTACH